MSDAVRLMKQNRTCGGASRKSKQNWSLQLGETLFAETNCFWGLCFYVRPPRGGLSVCEAAVIVSSSIKVDVLG